MSCDYCQDEACTCLTLPQFAVFLLAVLAIAVGVGRLAAAAPSVVVIDCQSEPDRCAEIAAVLVEE